MKNILLVLLIVILVGFGFYYFGRSNGGTKDETSNLINLPGGGEKGREFDRRASFAIFTNGTFRIFTASRYHNLSDEVFITAESPNIVNVKKSGITWFNFFETLPMSVTKECLTTGTGQVFCSNEDGGKLKFFLNGKRDDNLLDKEIQDGDKVLISFGDENKDISSQLEQVPEPN